MQSFLSRLHGHRHGTSRGRRGDRPAAVRLAAIVPKAAGGAKAGGAALGAVLLLIGSLLGPLFSSDPAVRHALTDVLVVAAVTQPLAGYVFVLDGVLIGAGDGPFLAKAAAVQTLAFGPAALAIGRWGPGCDGPGAALVSFAGGWMTLRTVLRGRLPTATPGW